MMIRRKLDLRTVVIEADAIEDRRLSAAAVGVLAFLAADAEGARPRAQILRRFRMTAPQLDACLAELREAGHLGEETALPPPRRSPREPRARDGLTQSGRLLLEILAGKADRGGTVSVLNRELAAETGQHPRTVYRNLVALEARGLLSREIGRDGPDGNTRRRIHLVPDPPDRTPPASPTAPEGTLQ